MSWRRGTIRLAMVLAVAVLVAVLAVVLAGENPIIGGPG
jgi:hypothetical protein